MDEPTITTQTHAEQSVLVEERNGEWVVSLWLGITHEPTGERKGQLCIGRCETQAIAGNFRQFAIWWLENYTRLALSAARHGQLVPKPNPLPKGLRVIPATPGELYDTFERCPPVESADPPA